MSSQVETEYIGTKDIRKCDWHIAGDLQYSWVHMIHLLSVWFIFFCHDFPPSTWTYKYIKCLLPHAVNCSYTYQRANLRSASTTEAILILLVLGTAETPFNARQETTETQTLKDGNIFLKHKTMKTNRKTNLERIRNTLWWRAIAHIWIIHRVAVLMSSLNTLGFNPTPLDRSTCPSSVRHGE